MHFLRSLAVSKAMVVIAFIGFSGIFAYGGFSIFSEAVAIRHLKDDTKLTNLAVSVGALTHELQKERGASAGFIASGGQNFVDALPAQRLKADAVIAEFTSAIKLVTDAGLPDPALQTLLNDVLAQIEALPELRQRVDKLDVKLLDAVGQITSINRSAIGLLPEMGKSVTYSQAANAVQRQAIFMTVKDIAGLERATGATGFALARSGDGVFPAKIHARFDKLIAQNTTLLTFYRALASTEILAAVDELLQSDVMAEVERMRNVVRSGNPEQITAIAPEEWFKTSTAMINDVKTIEDFGSQEIQGHMTAALEGAQSHLTVAVVRLIAIGGLFCVLAGFFTATASLALKTTAKRVSDLAEGDIESPIVQPSQKDLRSVTSALETFQKKELDRRKMEEKQSELENASAEGLTRITAEVSKGNFSPRLRLRDLTGPALILGEGVNEILAVADNFVTEQRERDEQILKEKQAEAEAQKAAAKDLGRVVSACSKGDFSKSMGTEGLEEAWEEVAHGINSIASTTDAALSDINRIMTALSDGNLGERMDDNYSGTFSDIAIATNSSLEQLFRAFEMIEASVHSMSDATIKIQAGTAQLAERSGDQSQTVESSREATERLTDTINSNKELLNNCRTTVNSLENQTRSSQDVAKSAVASMSAIEKASSEMNEIVATIEDIAFQTNLLALNASVEAARAGDAGKGFSVVASEVRSLATRCTTASSQISDLIAESVEEVTRGAQNVQKTGQAIEEIRSLLELVLESIDGISKAGEDQQNRVSSLNQSIEKMDQISRSNSTLATDNSHLVETFAALEKELRDTLDTFRGGNNSSHKSNLKIA